MTLQLNLSPDATAILERAAMAQNMALAVFVQEVAEREAARLASSGNGTARRRTSGYGKFAHLNVSSEDVHRDRREEVEREEVAFQARLSAGSA